MLEFHAGNKKEDCQQAISSPLTKRELKVKISKANLVILKAAVGGKINICPDNCNKSCDQKQNSAGGLISKRLAQPSGLTFISALK